MYAPHHTIPHLVKYTTALTVKVITVMRKKQLSYQNITNNHQFRFSYVSLRNWFYLIYSISFNYTMIFRSISLSKFGNSTSEGWFVSIIIQHHNIMRTSLSKVPVSPYYTMPTQTFRYYPGYPYTKYLPKTFIIGTRLVPTFVSVTHTAAPYSVVYNCSMSTS